MWFFIRLADLYKTRFLTIFIQYTLFPHTTKHLTVFLYKTMTSGNENFRLSKIYSFIFDVK